jgi:hypothetical protein
MISPLAAAVVFLCVSSGAGIGVLLALRLPVHHRENDSKDVLKLVMGLLATVAALVLSLLIVTAHGLYNTQRTEVQQLGVNVVLADQLLARFGPDAQLARHLLRQDVTELISSISPTEGRGAGILMLTVPPLEKDVVGEVQRLKPATPAQSFDQGRALDLLFVNTSIRLMIHEQASGGIPFPLIVVLVLWLMIIFVGFGMLAIHNASVIVSLLIGAFSVAAAVYLILDMSHPYRGLIQVSMQPLLETLTVIGR